MPCCGRSTTTNPRSDPRLVPPGDAVPQGRPQAQVPDVRLRYDGTRPIAAIGSATRRQYRFSAGAVLDVDGRDAASLAAIPDVRRAR